MKKLSLAGFLMLASGFAKAGQCYVNSSAEVSDLVAEMKSQKVFPAGAGNLLGFMLSSLNNDKVGFLEMHKKLISSYVQTGLDEIKSQKLQKELKKAAMKQIEKGYDEGRYSQSDALDLWENIYAPRISEIVKGRRNLLLRILKVLDSAEAASCAQTK